jgi:aminopeptidase N
MVAATSGTLISMTEEGEFNLHVIKERTPVTFPAILFGRLSIIENDPDYDAGEYKIRLYVHPGFEKDAQSFIDEAAAVIRFYEARFGKYPFMELDIAQMPIGTGYAQAPAGLVQMDGYTYVSKTDLVNLYNANDRTLDIRDNFVPHEIAHEWWGHKAGWGSSRDQWVSETFAEYSAALFIEERERQKSGEEGDISGYEDRKDRWGANGRLGHTFKRTGPIWIGNRVGDRRTSSIYARGPLVLDMLRQNLGKEVVLKMMYLWCELAAKNEGRVVTEDLELILKKIVPSFDFGEFMRLYVKGNEPLPDDPKKSKAGELGQSKF